MTNNSKADTARLFLSMLGEDHRKVARSEETYVPLAAREGLRPDEIAALSGTPIERVTQILSEA
ncbi:hypothetical protein LLS1_18770 [Leifsonia sp. LS1]|uniref:hypothetical protein n=1 Tax=Leifsonia sp. LS1 TaxID=2828483 RepID=UPI001CFCEB21|nr:hypothetical protein [Leifsonia sp. LS1]GIT80208.1 hypothetical protein LLS1_18770 [Leifsonia sp. LS1]